METGREADTHGTWKLEARRAELPGSTIDQHEMTVDNQPRESRGCTAVRLQGLSLFAWGECRSHVRGR